MDLTLVPIDELIKEVESRCTSFIAAYELPKDKKWESKFYFGKGNWRDSCYLSNILNNDVLNNWNGELQTLQRINQDRMDTE